jgi:hypothetical protein
MGMRAEREQYLHQFSSGAQSEHKTPRQKQVQESKERIKKESEYLRIQRENFLNGFASTPAASHGEAEMQNFNSIRGLNLHH